MKYRVLLLLTAVALVTLTARAEDKKKAAVKGPPVTRVPQAPSGPVTGDSQDFVYLADSRPVFVRVHIQVDGKPYAAAWDEFIAQLFKYLDRDGNGLLSKLEAEKTPSPQLLSNLNALYNGFGPASMSMLDSNRDGKVTREELASFYRRSGGGPFHFQFGQAETYSVDPYGQEQAPMAGALNDALFRYLDTDHDGKLSRAELAAMPSVLLALDLDEDEMVTIGELLPNLAQGGRRGFVRARMQQRAAPANSAFVQVGDSPEALTRQLLGRYGSKTGLVMERKLTRKEIGLDQAAFDELDLDKNGVLDAKELDRFARQTPDLEALLRLGRGANRGQIELIARKGQAGSLDKNIKQAGKGNPISLELGTTRLELRGNPNNNFYGAGAANLRMYYKQQFAAADTDKNGYLDMKEAARNGLFAASFKMMDRDNDGKLTEKEVLDFVDKIADLQSQFMAATVSLTIADQGRGLFDWVNTNRDGRLSVREMRNAIKLVDQLDRDGDGMISRGEIPRNYLVTLAQGPGNTNQNNVGFTFGGGMYNQQLPSVTAGPLWFRKMDRNRDGDVLRREFLGTDEEFKQIDSDGDGLISLQEAERADQLFRRLKR